MSNIIQSSNSDITRETMFSVNQKYYFYDLQVIIKGSEYQSLLINNLDMGLRTMKYCKPKFYSQIKYLNLHLNKTKFLTNAFVMLCIVKICCYIHIYLYNNKWLWTMASNKSVQSIPTKQNYSHTSKFINTFHLFQITSFSNQSSGLVIDKSLLKTFYLQHKLHFVIDNFLKIWSLP